MLISAFIKGLAIKYNPLDSAKSCGKTFRMVLSSSLTIVLMLGRYAGLDKTLGLAFATSAFSIPSSKR